MRNLAFPKQKIRLQSKANVFVLGYKNRTKLLFLRLLHIFKYEVVE